MTPRQLGNVCSSDLAEGVALASNNRSRIFFKNSLSSTMDFLDFLRLLSSSCLDLLLLLTSL